MAKAAENTRDAIDNDTFMKSNMYCDGDADIFGINAGACMSNRRHAEWPEVYHVTPLLAWTLHVRRRIDNYSMQDEHDI